MRVRLPPQHPMGRYRSLREAAEWLVDQGVTELVEN
jgi:hypothetical protein